MKIIFMGTIDFSVKVLNELTKEHEVVLVVTKPDQLVGRKQVLTYSKVKEYALEHNLHLFQPESIKRDYETILNTPCDLIVTAAFGQFVPDIVLNYPKYKAINVHGSLLPKYRGGSPIQTSIIKGEKETGISIIYMVNKMDAGDILAQEALPILDSDNNTTMFDKLGDLGAKMINPVINDLVNGNLNPIKQNEEEVTFAYNIKHEEQFINWNNTSLDIFNLIRGLSDEPSAITSLDNNLFKIFKSEIVEYSGNEEPGTILDINKKLLVKTKDKALNILEIQAAGKKKMDIKSYLNGQKLLSVGCVFSNNIL